MADHAQSVVDPYATRAPCTAPIALQHTLDDLAETAPQQMARHEFFSTRYEMLGEIGRGGMGIVYRVNHRALNRHVAVKVLLPNCSRDRFSREAKLLARIKSPHVVTVHDFDVLPDGSPMLVMDWVEGCSLLETLRGQPGCRISESQALAWMRQTCEGMYAAERQGIVHRDLKPANILIDKQGNALVADFGLARETSLSDSSGGPMTLTGLMGTPYYMAPEQAENPLGVDIRADVYSFGATFYHALTGAPPFEGDSAFSVLFKHKMEPLISPAARAPDISARTSELLERCLAKSPSDRFRSFAEILHLLEPTLGKSAWDFVDDPLLTPYLERYQAHRSAYLGEKWDGTDTYEFPHGRILRILQGNIVHQDVDAIVSSDDEDITMGKRDKAKRGVAMGLLEAGGPQIYEEARKFVPVRPGRVAVTSAGSLPVRFIFHGITLGTQRDASVRPSRDLIAEILVSCFYHADSYRVQSMALPLLGTGKGAFSREVCLDTMFRFLARMFLHGMTTVREARIVLFRGDPLVMGRK